MIYLSHKIEIKPNNKQKTYFRKAFGCARFAYNWGLEEWQRMYKNGEKPNGNKLRKRFNEIKKQQFPWMYEVSKFASEQALVDLTEAYTRFFKKTSNYPKPRRKRDHAGSFRIEGSRCILSSVNLNSKKLKKQPHNLKGKHQYLKVPRLGYVKMTEKLRFEGKCINITITQNGCKYYASFTMAISKEEYYRTHPKAKRERKRSIGIDMGIKHTLILSNGIAIENPRFYDNEQRKIKSIHRQMEKRVCAKTKQDKLNGVKKSSNYLKLTLRLNKAMQRITNRRNDFVQKVSSIIASEYKEIALENLDNEGMIKDHKFARNLLDASLGMFALNIQYKAENNGVKITKADRFFASSKKCSSCGNIIEKLTVKDRTYHCPCCGATFDRDYNAAVNLRNLIGVGYSEYTPADLTALLDRFDKNEIATSKVDTGKQHELQCSISL